MRRVRSLPEFKSRGKDTHKGNFGRVFVLAGSPGMTGAAYLCSKGALRSGSGLVTLGIPESLNSIMETKLTCVMTHPLPETRASTLAFKGREEIRKLCDANDVIALGPGLSQEPETRDLIIWLIANIERTLVIDADGINALVGSIDTLNKIRKNVVLTPHPGEMARLLNLGSTKDIQKDRLNVATRFVESINSTLESDKGLTLVMKGNETVVAGSDKVYVNHTGNPGMATAGSGDVLSGIIVSLIGQGMGVFEAAQTGVYIHGLAGDIASRNKGEASMIATDILNYLPDAFLHHKRERK
ncbi:MAG: NAD(P)H-hydrate dehydratase [Planctomycetes bacterium]|nr:NAD(P)H-hydrate dehydratase [Planctomycetota bacterium]